MKFVKCSTLVCVMLTYHLVLSQAPDTMWTRTFDGPSEYDSGNSIKNTKDGGYIIVGGKNTQLYSGGSDLWLIKTDDLGDTLWTKTYSNCISGGANSVQQTSDDGYIVTGTIWSVVGGDVDVYLIKTDSLGDTLWTKTFGGVEGDGGMSVQQTSDDGYIVTGLTGSFGAGNGDVWLIKTDALGDTLWTKTFGGVDLDIGRSVQQTSDNGYIIAGDTESFGAGNRDVWLIKTDALGDTLWSKTFGGVDLDIGKSVQQTSDDGYIITGVTGSFGAGHWDIWLIKTDALGDTLWTRTFGGVQSDEGNSVQQTSDAGYIVAGYTASFGAGTADVWLIKTDSLGNTLWTKTFGGVEWDRGLSVYQTSDDGYIVTGDTESFGSGNCDVWLLKTQPDPLNLSIHESTVIKYNFLHQNFPNPFNPITVISWQLPVSSQVNLTIYNLVGQKFATLLSASLPSGFHEYKWDASDLPSGVYLYRLEAGDFVESRKMVLMK
jgi:hypothetical protein